METPKHDAVQVEHQSFLEIFRSALISVRPGAELLWREKKKLFRVLSIEFILIIASIYLFAKPYYESTVTILPDYGNQSMLGSLSQLASLAGVSVGNATPTDIYENLITSEAVLEPVIDSKYLTEKFKDSVTLVQYFEITPDRWVSAELQGRQMFLECFKDIVKHRIVTDLSTLTKILDVTVKMPESKLSAEVINRVAKSLDNYVRTQRKSNASEQRFYLDVRITQVKDSLTSAEEILKKFKEENKVVEQSPELLLEQSRMMRNVDVLQTVFVQLTQQDELAKIDEIRDAPVLNIKEPAKDPVKKAGPPRIILSVILMVFVGGVTLAYFLRRNTLRSYWNELLKLKRDILLR